MKRLLIVSLTALAGCGQPTVSTVAATIGSSGGTLTSSDGIVTLTIPAGALPGPTQISIGAAQDVPADAQIVGRAYQIGPADTALAVEASLAMSNRVRAGNLAIATVEAGFWVPLLSQADLNQVTAALDRLGPCALVATRPGSGFDGGPVTGAAGTGGAGGGNSGGAGGGDPGGAGGGGGSAGASGGAGAPLDAAVDRDATGSGRDASDGTGLAGMDGSGVGGMSGAGGVAGGGDASGGSGGNAGSSDSSVDGPPG